MESPTQYQQYHQGPAPVPIMQEQSQGGPIPVDVVPDGSKHSNRERGRYKEKFQAMREKYEKATRQNEVFQKQLEVANAKINKLQAENDLLLDSMLINEEGLYNRFFPVSHPQDRFSGPPPEMHRRSPPIPRHAVPENLRRSRRLSNAVQPMNGGQNISPLPSNGRREHHPDSTGPKHIQSQHQFERPLEFISHDSNGRQ